MASYKPYIKKSNGTVDELPLDATTLGGIGANGFARASHTHTKSEVGLENVDNTADANKSVKYATTAGSANSVAWGNISSKPTTFPPDTHTHDDRYYTENEIDSKLNGKANSSHTHNYLSLSGGTLTGALNFSNNTWNLVGDDVYIGDYNQGGSLGIKGANGQTNIGFVNQSNDYYIKLTSPGVTANRTITMPDDTGTIALTKNIPTSLPANDVYDWAKASSKPSYSWSEINNKPTTFTPSDHNHNSLALTGTLDLKNSANGIKFNLKNHYVTNMQIGDVSLAMNSVSNGSIRTVTVTFDDYFKGEGYWYVVATAKGESNSAVPDSIVVSVTELTPSGFTIKARKIVNASGSGSPYIHVHYVAIKYS